MLRFVRGQTDKLGIAYSGGKDSMCCAELAKNMGFALEGFIAVRVFGLEFVDRICQAALRFWGMRVHIYPWSMGINEFRKAVYQPHWKELRALARLPLVDIEDAFRHETGVEWIAHGWRANDSRTRALALAANGGIDEKARRIFPLRRWCRDDVFSYLRQQSLPFPSFLGQADQAGIDLHPGSLAFFKRHFPHDYEKILEVYPYAQAALAQSTAH